VAQGASAQNREAWWGEVYGAWRLPVLRYVHRLTGDAALAEDVTQEAFLRLMSTPNASASSIQSPGSWLFRVAGNLVRDGARRTSTRDRATSRMEDPEPVERPDQSLERSESVRAVRKALNDLTAREREAVLMRQAGFEYSEIADVLGIQPQSVPTVVMRAMRRFRDAYQGDR
jgi:RNA polymerase sigma factor (sigma-70 family)